MTQTLQLGLIILAVVFIASIFFKFLFKIGILALIVLGVMYLYKKVFN